MDTRSCILERMTEQPNERRPIDRRPPVIAGDGEAIDYHGGGQDWVVTWHPATLPPPSGTQHGSAAVCLTVDRHVVLVSADGESWDLPGGRPEENEDWRATLDREVFEEACATVEEAALLGFSQGICTRGPEEGLVLVRSIWRAIVSLHPWEPQHEISHRLLVPAETALSRIASDVCQPIYRRWLQEALAGHGPA
jgi:ADP-ribose pyrophosphatase YjhB (NUDIX family)